MSVRARLEANLQETFDFAALAVYADALQNDGDPRGELIALDLYPSEDPAWWGRRRAALAGWLGGDVAARLGHLVQHGFVHDLREGPLAAEVLDGPLGDYVRGYTAWGAARVQPGLERLASRPRPWLARIAVTPWLQAPLDDDLCERIVAAAPRLAAIHVLGRPLFRSFHPIITTGDAPHGTATGAALHLAEIHFITDAVSVEHDANFLYAYYDMFPEPVIALLPRLRAGNWLELDGPVVRPARTNIMEPARHAQLARPFRRRYHSPLWFDVGLDPPVQLGSLSAHAGSILDELERLYLSPAQHRTLAAYLDLLARVSSRWTVVPPSLVTPIAIALDAILEQADTVAHRVDATLEQIATLYASPAAAKGVSLRVEYDDDW